MNTVSNIQTTAHENVFSAGQGVPSAVVFRSADQVTEAEISSLLHAEEKNSLSATLPRISPPKADADPRAACEMPASMGATVLTLIVKIAADSRRASADQRTSAVEKLIGEIKEQAKELRQKGQDQWENALTSALITIGVNLASAGISFLAAPKMAAGKNEMIIAAKMNTLNTRLSALSTIGGAVSSAVQGYGAKTAGLHDEQIKLHEAEQERVRAEIDNLRTTEESLMELVRKAIAAQDAIQQNTNQTRSKILG